MILKYQSLNAASQILSRERLGRRNWPRVLSCNRAHMAVLALIGERSHSVECGVIGKSVCQWPLYGMATWKIFTRGEVLKELVLFDFGR